MRRCRGFEKNHQVDDRCIFSSDVESRFDFWGSCYISTIYRGYIGHMREELPKVFLMGETILGADEGAFSLLIWDLGAFMSFSELPAISTG